MKIPVSMVAFHDERPPLIREVEVPDDTRPEDLLDEVFRLGQNDFQPVPDRCSVSVGDVILLGDRFVMVAGSGFVEMNKEQYDKHVSAPRRDLSVFETALSLPQVTR